MASLTIRNIEPEHKKKLKIRAAKNDRSMEEELRVMIKHYLTQVDQISSKTVLDLTEEEVKPYAEMDIVEPSKENPLKGSVLYEGDLISPIDDEWEAES